LNPITSGVFFKEEIVKKILTGRSETIGADGRDRRKPKITPNPVGLHTSIQVLSLKAALHEPRICFDSRLFLRESPQLASR
jgi:hypothetical protein